MIALTTIRRKVGSPIPFAGWLSGLLAAFLLTGQFDAVLFGATSASGGQTNETAETQGTAAAPTSSTDGPLRRAHSNRVLANGVPANVADSNNPESGNDAFEDPVAGPREMLRLFQIGESRLGLFADGKPLTQDGLSILVRLLYRAPSFPRHKLDRWADREFDAEDFRNDPNRYRGTIVALRGDVAASDRIAVLRRYQERFGFDHYYRLVVRTNDFDAIVYCRRLPSAWRGQSVGQHVRVVGMFAKIGEEVAKMPTPNGDDPRKREDLRNPQGLRDDAPLVVVTDLPAWHPTTVDSARQITADHILLSRLGVDVGRLAYVEDRTRLTADDREAFYQLLDAAGRVRAEDLHEFPSVDVDVTELLQHPETHRGRQSSLIGTIRRVTRIVVSDVDIVARFGIDHYFEIELITVPAVTVRFVDSDGNDKIFHRYPVTVCIPEIPDWLPIGEGLKTDVRASGFFLKHWAYRSEYMSNRSATPRSKELARAAPTAGGTRDELNHDREATDASKSLVGVERLQISPLLIGTRIRTFQGPANTYRSSWLGIAFAGLIVAVAVFAWTLEKNSQSGRRRRPRFVDGGQIGPPTESLTAGTRESRPNEKGNPSSGVGDDLGGANVDPTANSD